ncbi:MAG: thioredoxin fold domain-containing protein [Gammaproteobacteria bacterium]|nr:thioredoxin fold domain-containing protein [Gammaproteobacteria bacterium]
MAAAPHQNLSEGMVNPGFHEKPEWFKLSFMELAEDVAEASEDGKRVVLYFYQDGCPYCKKLLEVNFRNSEIVKKMKSKFELIAINMWGDKEVVDLNGKETIEKDFAASLNVMYTPTLIFLNEKGKSVLRINGYYYPEKFSAALDYVSGKKESQLSFSSFYKSKRNTGASGKLHIQESYLQPPYNLANTLKTSPKPLLVLFEKRECVLCDELHQDIMKKPEVENAIKPFNVILLDKTSKGILVTPEGKRVRIAKWADALNIQHTPSLVFFDKTGKEVFRTEAYLRTFHIAGAMTYVSTGSYKKYPSFQRYLQKVNEDMTKKGIKVDLMR